MEEVQMHTNEKTDYIHIAVSRETVLRLKAEAVERSRVTGANVSWADLAREALDARAAKGVTK
jgi:hypothetical protein